MEKIIEELTKLLKLIGLSPKWISVVVLLAIILGFLVLRYLRRKSKQDEIEATYRSNRRAKIDDELQEYSKTQGEELIEAYRMLYEGEINETIEPSKFVEIVRHADKRIMKPYTKYKLLLDKAVRLKIIAIHNILEQFLHEPSKDAIIQFLAYKQQFYKKIEEADSMIQIKCVQK